MGSGEVQEVEIPGTSEGLRAALHPQLATEVVDMPFHRIHTQDQATGNLTVRGALKQQAQHVALALGERFHKRTRARRGEREIRDVLLTKDSQEGSNITRYDAACISLAQ